MAKFIHADRYWINVERINAVEFSHDEAGKITGCRVWFAADGSHDEAADAAQRLAEYLKSHKAD